MTPGAVRLSRSSSQGRAARAFSRRIAWLIAARLVVLTVLLGFVALGFGNGLVTTASKSETPFTPQLASVTLGVAFALAAVYSWALRTERGLLAVADAQLVFDQLTWTVLVYLTGGVSSGATSLYGLSCVAGAVLTGLRGATIAAVSAAVAFAALVVGLTSGVLLPPPDQVPRLYSLKTADLQYHLLVNALSLVVVTLLAGYLSERLRLTGGQLAEAQERVRRAERMAALGRLAAGLAHEIRNPLGSISGSVQLLKMSDALDDDERRLCDIITREASRLNDLVSDMMDLSKPRVPAFVPMDLAGVARDVVLLAGRSGRSVSDVAVELTAPDQLWLDADGAQLRQLLWNLVRNAVQASAPGDTVQVVLAASEDRCLVHVIDQGVGIDPESVDMLFDAFFTTRSQGTGVGLAVVKAIADAHGFEVSVDSTEGEGTRFTVDVTPRRRAAPPEPAPADATVAQV